MSYPFTSEDWTALELELDTIEADYLATDHAARLKTLLDSKKVDIDRIVIMGIGTNIWQLVMIKTLATALNLDGEIYSQEDYSKDNSNSDPDYIRPADEQQKYINLHKHLDIHFEAFQTDEEERTDVGPITSKIGHKTLLFCPFLPSIETAAALDMAPAYPAVYIGSPMGTVVNGCRGDEKELADFMERHFIGNYDWQGFLKLKVDESHDWNKVRGSFHGMIIGFRQN